MYMFNFFFSLLYLLFICPTVSNLHHNNCNNNCNYSLFCSQRRFSYHVFSIHMHFQTRLIEFLLTVVVCFVLPFYSPTPSIKLTFFKQKVAVLAFWRILSRACTIYLSNRHAHCCWFIWTTFDVFVSVYLCIHCLLLRSLSLRLRFLFLSFSYPWSVFL